MIIVSIKNSMQNKQANNCIIYKAVQFRLDYLLKSFAQYIYRYLLKPHLAEGKRA